jgi:Cu/Ag efflux pump CusA
MLLPGDIPIGENIRNLLILIMQSVSLQNDIDAMLILNGIHESFNKQFTAQDLPAQLLAPISSIMGEIMFVALHSSDRHNQMELKTSADWTLRPRLLAVPGIAEVIPNGGQTKVWFSNPEIPQRAICYTS